ncbi:Vacuolar protein sorting-associated protein 52 [Cyanidiococcus yangmingshanensis]|uniref:Vacuolar protein sorting-associated protein 52 n=1 Tax=Cyanidiococcus yangmingshanensis TaxID=2690220 RepID=A0A7J7IEH8_9RHOD|nr:Vacuolar protein sorting-associated protein 52 [Cyanidiococcus yangmingshanensis]
MEQRERLLPVEDFETAWRVARLDEPLMPPKAGDLDRELRHLMDRLASELDAVSGSEQMLSPESIQEVQELYLHYERELRALESTLFQRVTSDEPLVESTTSELVHCEGFFTSTEENLRKMLDRLGVRKRRLAFHEAESRDLSRRVRTTREAAAHLQAFAVELVLPPALIQTLTTREKIDETYLEELKRFRNKLAFAGLADVQRTAAYQDLRPVLDQVQNRVIARLEAFLSSQISRLEEPNTNIQILQQNLLLKYRYFAEFLQDVAPGALENIHRAYVGRMSRVYLNLFRQYLDALMELREPDQNLGDMLIVPVMLTSSFAAVWHRLLPTAPSLRLSSMLAGAWTTTRKTSGSVVASGGGNSIGSGGLTSQASSAPSGLVSGTGLASGVGLVHRLKILEALSEPPLVVAVVRNESRSIPAERVFWSVGRMLLETCAAERSFCTEFFGAIESSMLEKIMQPARDQVTERFVQYAASATDLIGLLLCLRIVQAQRAQAHERELSCLETYFTRAELATIPRVKEVLDANEQSLVEADPRMLYETALSSVGSEPDSEMELARRVHPVVQRYADLAQALLAMAVRAPSSDAMMLKSLHMFQREMHRVLHGMAERFQSAQNRNAFLINQLGTIVERLNQVADSIPSDSTPVSGAGRDTLHDMLDELRPRLETCMNQLAELALMNHFREFLTLRRGPTHTSGGHDPHLAEHWRLVLAEFRTDWKIQLEQLSKAVIRSFPNWEIGSVVLKRAFQELRRYNSGLHRVLPWESSTELRALLVDDAALVFEMRRFVKMETDLEPDQAQ